MNGTKLYPVRVDPDGRIWHAGTGEPVVLPGLDPASVLAGLADMEAGRTVTLEELWRRRDKATTDTGKD